MPRSKRERAVNLTQTKKAGRARKEALVANIRQSCEKYLRVVSFQLVNQRNTFLKDIRARFDTSRFFLGRNRLMQIAMGRTEAEEPAEGLSKIAAHLTGTCGLCFTNVPKDEIIAFFRDYKEEDYARTGFEATETVVLPEGPLPPQFEHSMEPYLRNTLFMATEVKDGRVCLVKEYVAATAGEKLTPEQARVLKLLGKKMSTCSFTVTAVAERASLDANTYEVEEFVEAEGIDAPTAESENEEEAKKATTKKAKAKAGKKVKEEEEEEDDDDDDEEM